MLEQDARDAAKLPGVLAHHGVFELQNIDPAIVDLAMNQPREIGISKFAHRVGLDRADRFLPALHAHDVFGRCANAVQFPVQIAFDADNREAR